MQVPVLQIPRLLQYKYLLRLYVLEQKGDHRERVFVQSKNKISEVYVKVTENIHRVFFEDEF